MDIGIFVRGVTFGFAIAAPVGPIGVLCIRRTLAYGRAYGLVSGLGAATADAVYGAIAGLGLAFVGAWLLRFGVLTQVLGGCFLCYLGATTFFSRPPDGTARSTGNLASTYLSTFVLTMANPLTILTFGAIFASIGDVGGRASTVALVGGVFAGSACWWLVLTISVSLLRRYVNTHRLVWINRVSGSVLSVFGLLVLLYAL